MSALQFYEAFNLATECQRMLVDAARKIVQDSVYSDYSAAMLVDRQQFRELELALKLYEEKPLTEISSALSAGEKHG